MNIETPFYELGQFFTVFYFAYFLLLLPVLNFYESCCMFAGLFYFHVQAWANSRKLFESKY